LSTITAIQLNHRRFNKRIHISNIMLFCDNNVLEYLFFVIHLGSFSSTETTTQF
jgi:hypothetical protein